MAELSAEQVAAVAYWVDAQARGRASFTAQTLSFLGRLVATMTGGVFYNESRARAFAAQAATQVRAAQVATANLTAEYLRQVVTATDPVAGRAMPRTRVVLPERPRGIDPLEEWVRPAEQYRYARSIDHPEEVAIARALLRAQTLADTDIALAMREASRQVLTEAAQELDVRGYRRVIHPELSRTGVCGLCAAAAGNPRPYQAEEQLPFHEHCRCEVLPILGDPDAEGGVLDPGAVMNRADLAALYEAAGGTAGERLKRVRYRLDEHGELGMVLRPVKTGDAEPADPAASAAT